MRLISQATKKNGVKELSIGGIALGVLFLIGSYNDIKEFFLGNQAEVLDKSVHDNTFFGDTIVWTGDLITGESPRDLTIADLEQISSRLHNLAYDKNEVTRVVAIAESGNALYLAAHVKSYLESRGYKTEGVDTVYGFKFRGETVNGIIIIDDSQEIIVSVR